MSEHVNSLYVVRFLVGTDNIVKVRRHHEFEQTFKLKSLIMAQIERWRQA